jgi:hypothetical protein
VTKRTHAPSTTTTAILVALCAAMGGYLFLTKDRISSTEQTERRSNLFRVFRRDDLGKIVVHREGDDYTLLRDRARRDAGEVDTWKIQASGRTELADESMIDGLLSALELSFPERRIAATEVDKDKFGLTTPRLVTTLTMGTLTTTLRLGGPAPTPEGAVYAEVDGEVSVVKMSRLGALDRPAEAYTSRRLSPYLSTELTKITILVAAAEGATPKKQVLERQQDGSFFLEGQLLDRFSFDKALSAFADLTLTATLDEAAAKAAQPANQAWTTVTLDPLPLEGKPRPAITLRLGGSCPLKGHEDETVARREGDNPTAGCVERAAAEALGERLRPELRAFRFREDEVEEISLSRGTQKLEIARKDKGFHQRLPEERDLALEEARGFVKALVSSKAESILPPGDDPKELAHPVGEVRLTATARPDAEVGTERIVIGEPRADGKVPVKRETDGAVLIFSKEAADAFLPRATSLRPHRILDRKPEDVRRIVVTPGTGSEARAQTVVRGDDAVWSLAQPSGLPLDAGVATDMAEAVARLTAERWVADQNDGSFGLEKPSLTVEVTFASDDPAAKLRLTLGDPVPGGVLAQRAGDSAVFVLPTSWVTTLSDLAIDRQALSLDDHDIEKVTLTEKGKGLDQVPPASYAYENGTFVAKAGGSTRSAERVREALAGLRAETALHTGPARPSEGLSSPRLVIAATGTKGKPDVRLSIGSSDTFRGKAIVYVRREGLPVTFVVPEARVRPLFADGGDR